uniref:Uncharacterized protein n=1 Tax=Rhizophora mucronata TaxID=61149 RepID=A0A2P2N0Z6_RHIMU
MLPLNLEVIDWALEATSSSPLFSQTLRMICR